MKKHLFMYLVALAGFGLASCESQRTTGTAEGTNTTEKVTADQVPAPETDTNDAGGGTGTNTGTTTMDQADTGEVSAETAAQGAFVSDADFAAKAVASGMAEVKFGNLAERKAVNPDVKKFGVQMVQDHTRANAVLMRISKLKKWPTPEDMDAEHQQAYSRLATVMSDEFDQGYMAQMVKDHEMAVAMFQEASTKATDAELKTYAANTLPALKMHLGMARDLQKRLEAAR